MGASTHTNNLTRDEPGLPCSAPPSHLLLLSSALVLGSHVENAVGIDLEGDLDLGLAAGGGRDAVEVELAELVVVLGHGALALKDLEGGAGGNKGGDESEGSGGEWSGESSGVGLAGQKRSAP